MNTAARWSIAAALVALVALLVIGAVLISAYIEQERQRDLLQWESRLGLVADAKADAINRLLAAERRNLEELAGNASLRFYLWQLRQAAAREPDAAGTDPGALGYLRNLLLGAAERYGYEAAADYRLPASIAQPRIAGLVIFDADLNPVVTTPGLVDVRATFGPLARRALEGRRLPAVELMRDAQDQPVVATVVPIEAVPGTRGSGNEAAFGVLLGVRSAEAELYPLLTRGPSFTEENESLLLERRGDVVMLLSPTHDGAPGLRRTLPAERADLAEVAAVATPERFVMLDNYRGRQVLQVSRTIRGQNWVLAQQVDAVEGLSLANDRRRFLLIALTLLLFAVAAVAVAAWRHGSSVRARHQADELRDKAARLRRQTDLLHAITDNLDALILLVSRNHRVLFVNRAAAAAVAATMPEVLDRPLGHIVPAAISRDLDEGIAELRQRGAVVHRLVAWPVGDATRRFLVSFIPVERIEAEANPVLLVLSDVTSLEDAHQRNTGLLRRLVMTLASVVDRHDPYAADHARRMTEVVDALARELGFSDKERETLDLAASLANIGKIMVPVEVLTKKDPLSASEQELLRRHVEYGLELLRDLQFDGPVLDIIAQKQERLDGRGYPQGLQGERITLAGQVLAVANAFVALVSGRAYRAGLPVKAAIEELMRAAGTEYERRVVAALFHITENRQDWSAWQEQR